MYIKRVEGPRAVTLPDGRVLTLADLPPPDTRRWVASRKAVVIDAVESGLISRKAALERYALSEEEYEFWREAVAKHGVEALKVTSLQKYRQP
ncbi:MAG: CtrA inhibitor SciP [Roseinatronobacter sp.]